MATKRLLIVDDEGSVRSTRAMVCRMAGYQVTTAEHGFDALLQLKSRELPDVILSDLNMPHMSGFEFLSVVRRRFPQIRVIASSGAYNCGELMPCGVIADAFYPKSCNDPRTLLELLAEVMELPTGDVEARNRLSAPVWIPSNGKDSSGIPFVVVTCTDCLRSFPVNTLDEEEQHVHEAECLYCSTKMQFFVDLSIGAATPRARALVASQGAGSPKAP